MPPRASSGSCAREMSATCLEIAAEDRVSSDPQIAVGRRHPGPVVGRGALGQAHAFAGADLLFGRRGDGDHHAQAANPPPPESVGRWWFRRRGPARARRSRRRSTAPQTRSTAAPARPGPPGLEAGRQCPIRRHHQRREAGGRGRQPGRRREVVLAHYAGERASLTELPEEIQASTDPIELLRSRPSVEGELVVRQGLVEA